jgi:hypothetical protein
MQIYSMNSFKFSLLLSIPLLLASCGSKDFKSNTRSNQKSPQANETKVNGAETPKAEVAVLSTVKTNEAESSAAVVTTGEVKTPNLLLTASDFEKMGCGPAYEKLQQALLGHTAILKGIQIIQYFNSSGSCSFYTSQFGSVNYDFQNGQLKCATLVPAFLKEVKSRFEIESDTSSYAAPTPYSTEKVPLSAYYRDINGSPFEQLRCLEKTSDSEWSIKTTLTIKL